jgi:uncharacterized membrane protein (DUF485 family)
MSKFFSIFKKASEQVIWWIVIASFFLFVGYRLFLGFTPIWLDIIIILAAIIIIANFGLHSNKGQ